MRLAIGAMVVGALCLVVANDAAAKGGKKGKNAPTVVYNAETFKQLDANGDKKVTLGEFKSVKLDPQIAEKTFKVLDKDDDGFLTLDEFRAGQTAQLPAEETKSDSGKKGKKRSR